ncbi:hypothetical protein WDU99_13565 [Microbacterium sp. Mu-80]|uniref:Uncharacterized protein n=1 Tax=Microbacterium bandirmense TaxID=3122050 RepID=A0ABU8LF67_9MICO
MMMTQVKSATGSVSPPKRTAMTIIVIQLIANAERTLNRGMPIARASQVLANMSTHIARATAMTNLPAPAAMDSLRFYRVVQ